MKKILLFLTLCLAFTCNTVLADDAQDALKFFNNYVAKANSYSPEITTMYSPKAKIIRQVVKPDGGLVNVNTDTATYVKQMRLGQTIAKIRNYKNKYSNVQITKVANGYKISSLRQPMKETYWLKTYMIVQKQSSGKWLIVEELMQTKEQIFLKYAK